MHTMDQVVMIISQTLYIVSVNLTRLNDIYTKHVNSTENIADHRHAVLWAMLLEVKKLIVEYLHDKPTKCKLKAQEPCDSYILGCLIRAFQRTDTYPLSETLPVMSKSIQELKEILSSIKLSSNAYFSDTHFQCQNCRPYGSIRILDGNGYCNGCGSTGPKADNHAKSCSPLKKFREVIEAIYNNVEGLNPADFIRWRSEGPKKESVGPHAGKSLWDFIE